MLKWKDVGIQFIEDDDGLSASDICIINCPKCKPKRKVKDNNTLYVNLRQHSWFCKHCGWSGSLISGERHSDALNPFNPNLKSFEHNTKLKDSTVEKFKQKGISYNTLVKLKVGQNKAYFPQAEQEMSSIIFPYYKGSDLLNLVYFYNEKRHNEFGGVRICFGYNDILDDNTYVVLDEFEKMAFTEAGVDNCISLFGAAQDISKISQLLDFLPNIEERMSKVKKITIAMPNTDYGRAVRDELVRRFGRAICWTVALPQEDYNWSRVLVEYGTEQLKELLQTAKPTPVRGIFELDDVEEAFDNLYLYGLRKGSSTGFKEVDPYYTVLPGQWTLVTGIPGHGKSNFLDSVIVNLATHEGWNFAIFSPENQPIQRHYANLLEKKMGKPFSLGEQGRMTLEEKEVGKAFIKNHFSIVLPDEEDNWSLDGILDLAKVLVYRKGIKGLVIDPWNEIDHSRRSNQTETEYISECLTKIRHFGRNYDVHIWVVAHPTKMGKDSFGRYLVPTPYDVSGSAHFRNKADNALSVWRNVDGKDRDIADIYVQKIRYKEVGRVGVLSMRYNYKNGQFYEDIDQARRAKGIESGIHEETTAYLKKSVPKAANLGLFKKTDFKDIDEDF